MTGAVLLFSWVPAASQLPASPQMLPETPTNSLQLLSSDFFCAVWRRQFSPACLLPISLSLNSQHSRQPSADTGLHPALSCSKQLLSATSAAGAFKKWPLSWCAAVQLHWPTMWSCPSSFGDFQAQERLCWALSRRWPFCLPPPCFLVRLELCLHAVLHGGLAPIAPCHTYLTLQGCACTGEYAACLAESVSPCCRILTA